MKGLSSLLLAGSILLGHISAVPIPDHSDNDSKDYIVVFKDSIEKRGLHHEWVNKHVVRDSNVHGVKGHFEIGTKFAGYHGKFNDEQIAHIKRSDEVETVEEDTLDRVQGNIFLEENSPWGLGRISHKDNPLGGVSQNQYLYDSSVSDNSVVYVIDTGIRSDHQEFTGRLRKGPNYVNDNDEDESGHGTHVAGIAAGANVGVNKNAEVVAVKILDKNEVGSLSSFLKAIQWVIDDHNSNPDKKAVINYSAVGEISDSRSKAISSAVDSGIIFVGAAGNKGGDACGFGPPNSGPGLNGQIVVGALNYTDYPASFTNHGNCVKMFAPGVEIKSSYLTSPTSYATMSGSSMSSPYVAGLASYYWALDSGASMDTIVDRVLNANQGKVNGDLQGTPNKMAYNGA